MNSNRRTFLQTSAVATAAMSLRVAGTSATDSDSDDVRVAVIGVKGRGGNHIGGMKKNVVALCDVDAQHLEKRADGLREGGRTIDTYTDFRKLLERDDINAVSIATPNHLHSLIGILAAQAGKDVYVEKPVSHNVWEGRQLAQAARRYNRIIQCGTQSRSSPSLHEAVEFVRGGNLGEIQYAIGTCYKRRASIGKLDKPLEIPKHVDYDLWCGPAAKVDLYRPRLHYDWHWDFNTGNGDMGNQGIHQMDIARWFLGEDKVSKRVLSVGGRVGYEDAGNTPNTQIVLHMYDKAPLIFETRGLPTKSGSDRMDRYRGSGIGVIVQCEKGHILIPSYTSAIAYDSDGNAIQEWKGGGDHYANFLKAVASRNPDDLNAEVLEGHLSSALCHTGGVSHQLGKKATAGEIRDAIKSDSLFTDSFERMVGHLSANGIDVDEPVLTLGSSLEMDQTTESFTNMDEANALVRREDRAPFTVPEVTV
jgi:predicted dehydrogenase